MRTKSPGLPSRLQVNPNQAILPVLHLYILRAKITTPTSIQAFLSACGRKVKAVEPDGNCLFRAISHQLLGTEEEHLFIRGLLLRFENLKAELFQKYTVPGVTEANIHVNKVSTPRVWGTHIEVVATATLFVKPVYLFAALHQGDFAGI